MKKIQILILSFLSISVVAQTTFQYDIMGNRIKKDVLGNPPMAPLNNLSSALNVTLGQQVPYSLNQSYNPALMYKWEVGNGTMTQNTSGNFCQITWNINIQPNFVKLTLTNGTCANTRAYPVALLNAPPCLGNSLTLVRPTNNLTLGNSTFKAGTTISATNSVSNGSYAYEAGQSITLSPGFEAKGNTVFKAEIKGCN